MEREITYREIQQGETEKVCALIMGCFNEFVAPGYSREGVIEFSQYVNSKSMELRLAHNHFIILGLDHSEIIGMIEVRENYHISLFFVKKEYHHQGVGHQLLELAINKSRSARPDLAFLEVNSSPYAVPIYQKFGFQKVANEQVTNGIRYTPLVYNLV
jgi:ribosomal protein S18 acetylase RimI-like enzyme